jgi:hypothetical protein
MKIVRHAIVASLLLTGTAAASTFVVTDEELGPDIFPQVADSIRANLDGPNAPTGLTTARKQDVLRSLQRIEEFLDEDPEGNGSKIRSEQRRINAALAPTVAKNDGKSEVICRRIRKVGTNIPTTECRTREEMEREEQHAEAQIERWQQGRATD